MIGLSMSREWSCTGAYLPPVGQLWTSPPSLHKKTHAKTKLLADKRNCLSRFGRYEIFERDYQANFWSFLGRYLVVIAVECGVISWKLAKGSVAQNRFIMHFVALRGSW